MIANQGTIRVLLVDDDPDDHFLFRDLLRKISAPSCTLDWCDSYEMGRAVVAEEKHDLYFIDYQLGSSVGLDLLKGERGALSLPAVLLTANENPALEVAATEAGFVDYLVKDQLSVPLLGRAIRYALTRHRAHLLRIWSRAEEDRRGPIDVERVIEATLRKAWNEIRHRARLIKDYERVPAVEASESRLGQVLLNLIVNAAHAIPEGNVRANTIRISTGMGACGRVLVRIADTGGTEFTVALPTALAEPLSVASSASTVPPPSKRRVT